MCERFAHPGIARPRKRSSRLCARPTLTTACRRGIGHHVRRREHRWIIDPPRHHQLHPRFRNGVSIGTSNAARSSRGGYDPARNATASRRGAFQRPAREGLRGPSARRPVATASHRSEPPDLYTRRACRPASRRAAPPADLAYVACGRLDAFWELGLALGHGSRSALIQEAGGLVATSSGSGLM